MVSTSSVAIRQESSDRAVQEAAARPAPTTGTQIDSCLRRAIRYSDLIRLGSRVGRPWFRFTRNGHYMVEVGWEGGGPTTTHCLSELTVIRSNDRFACI